MQRELGSCLSNCADEIKSFRLQSRLKHCSIYASRNNFVKLVELSGWKKEYLKAKINELVTKKSKNKNIRDMYRGIEELRRVNNPELTF
jgi:hypothetical protein